MICEHFSSMTVSTKSFLFLDNSQSFLITDILFLTNIVLSAFVTLLLII
jgi:hypothetical protein